MKFLVLLLVIGLLYLIALNIILSLTKPSKKVLKAKNGEQVEQWQVQLKITSTYPSNKTPLPATLKALGVKQNSKDEQHG
ncbi:hypothetical protein [Catenovulum maritimum]|uniref:Uncharacterized protein n=1 Tax=Catenovulum maritimum TaxID=1513271 RepID=A0A0J8GP50_9ALTE|nr:hypothetical protein [Catenovulum maritimum]KMT64542.1 hypothetical protein XM47_13885 [Catenovulum maritimum]